MDYGSAILGHEIDHGADNANSQILIKEIETRTTDDKVNSEFIPTRITNRILHEMSNTEKKF